VSEYSLTAESALAGLHKSYGDTELQEITERAIVSMATPKEGKKTLASQIKTVLKIDIPAVGKFSSTDIDNTQLLRIQADQCLVLFDYSGNRAVPTFARKIDSAYLSDQTDSWVILRLSGSQSREALARICAIDLHSDNFGPGSVTRTLMEHMGAIIICEQENEYTLMALRSFADCFLHEIQLSIENVSG
jgi:sarcosine oxidase subunit gamma